MFKKLAKAYHYELDSQSAIDEEAAWQKFGAFS